MTTTTAGQQPKQADSTTKEPPFVKVPQPTVIDSASVGSSTTQGRNNILQGQQSKQRGQAMAAMQLANSTIEKTMSGEDLLLLGTFSKNGVG